MGAKIKPSKGKGFGDVIGMFQSHKSPERGPVIRLEEAGGKLGSPWRPSGPTQCSGKVGQAVRDWPVRKLKQRQQFSGIPELKGRRAVP